MSVTKLNPVHEAMVSEIALYGYGVYQLRNGRFIVADPQDDKDGFYVDCRSISEAYAEWHDTVQPDPLESEPEMERDRRG